MKKNQSKTKRPILDLKPPVDPKLIESVGALRALTTTHNLLNEGFWAKAAWPAVEQSQKFIQSIHAEALATALRHPDADRIAELKDLKGAPHGQVQATK